MWHTQPAVGECELWGLDLPGMLWKTSRSWRAPLFCAVHHHGQVEGAGARQDEGKLLKVKNI